MCVVRAWLFLSLKRTFLFLVRFRKTTIFFTYIQQNRRHYDLFGRKNRAKKLRKSYFILFRSVGDFSGAFEKQKGLNSKENRLIQHSRWWYGGLHLFKFGFLWRFFSYCPIRTEFRGNVRDVNCFRIFRHRSDPAVIYDISFQNSPFYKSKANLIIHKSNTHFLKILDIYKFLFSLSDTEHILLTIKTFYRSITYK